MEVIIEAIPLKLRASKYKILGQEILVQVKCVGSRRSNVCVYMRGHFLKARISCAYQCVSFRQEKCVRVLGQLQNN